MNLFVKNYIPIILVVVIVFCIYLPGISGTLYYDDLRPLQKLQSIDGWTSAGLYITSETSGPLGRPISMLTFALQQHSWPNNVDHFLLFNVLLHLTNGFLVYLLSLSLLNYMQKSSIASNAPGLRHEVTASLIAAFWLLSPIQISATLITIQRMTGLSAFFVLSGILIYVYGLQNSATQLRRARVQQICGLGLMTLLAVFSKENGILLPVMALVLEKSLFRQINDPDKKLRLKFLWSSFIVVACYLIYVVLSLKGVYLFRNFDMLDRVLTQPYILLTYLKLSFIPDIFAYNPFHDDVKAFTFDSLPWFGLLAIITVCTLFVFAYFSRRRNPVISFAIIWFFSAHILESTVIGLELYFEHRNYVALFGPCFAVSWYLSKWSRAYPRLIITGTVCYLLLLGLITGFICTLWGAPTKAAEAWFDKQLGSSRAAEHLATIYLREGYGMQAYFTLKTQTQACGNCIGSHTQFMLVSCLMDDPYSAKQSMNKVRELALTERIIGGTSITLHSLKKHIEKNECKHISMQELDSLNKVLLQHQTKEISPHKRFELLLNLHQLAEHHNNLDDSQSYLLEAYELMPRLKVGEVVFNSFIKSRDFFAAKNFLLSKVCSKPPMNWFAREHYYKRCELMQVQLRTATIGVTTF